MLGRQTLWGWTTAVAATALLAGCGADKKARNPAGGPIALAVRYDDGVGERVRTGRLTCTADAQRAAGALAGPLPVARLCSQARAIATLLTKGPPAGRRCTRIYGGPQSVRVTGTIDGRAFNRRFTRTNGCEVEDYRRVTTALPFRR
jgi:hypothetical protein